MTRGVRYFVTGLESYLPVFRDSESCSEPGLPVSAPGSRQVSDLPGRRVRDDFAARPAAYFVRRRPVPTSKRCDLPGWIENRRAESARFRV